MHNNKLITILKHFNKADLNQFHKYIVSPYFNKSKQLIQFYEKDYLSIIVFRNTIYCL